MAATAVPTPVVTITLSAFSFPFDIGGQTIQCKVPAGVTATFAMPAIGFTSDSSVPADSTEVVS